MARLGKTYQLDAMQAAARHRLNSLLHPHSAQAACREGQVSHGLGQAATAGAGGAAGTGAGGSGLGVCGGSISGSSAAVRVCANVWGVCDVCREEVPDMRCSSCRRWLHALCSNPPALTPAEYPYDMKHWNCPACGAANTVSNTSAAAGTVVLQLPIGRAPAALGQTSQLAVPHSPQQYSPQLADARKAATQNVVLLVYKWFRLIIAAQCCCVGGVVLHVLCSTI